MDTRRVISWRAVAIAIASILMIPATVASPKFIEVLRRRSAAATATAVFLPHLWQAMRRLPPARGHMLAALLFVCALAGAPQAYAQVYSEAEPNDPCGSAQDLTSATLPLQVTGYKTQPYGNAVDFFKFTAAPGTKLRAQLSGDSSQPVPLTAFGLGAFTADCPSWPNIPNFSAWTIGSPAQLDITVPADGTFVIGVTACCDGDFSGSGTIEGAYVLSLAAAPPPTVITGLVIDANTGVGPPYAGVSLEQCYDYGGWGACYPVQAVPVDSQGYFRFEGELEGNFRVKIYADPNSYEQPVVIPTGPTGYESVFIARGSHYDFGVIPMVPIVPVDSISGQVLDRFTGRPLAGTVEPFARVQLYRWNDYWWELFADIPTGNNGNYSFSSASVGRALLQGNYAVVGTASQYQATDNYVEVLNVQPREARVAPPLKLRSNPVRFTNVRPCDNIPAQGGPCDFSYNVTVGTGSRMIGTAWSLVHAWGMGGFTNDTAFQACEQPLTLVFGTSAATQEVRCRFTVPTGVPAYAVFCPDARFGEDSRANPHMTVQGAIDPLFCLMKLPGQGGFKAVPQRGAIELMRTQGTRK